MDGPPSQQPMMEVSSSSKKRRVVQKTVVKVRMEANVGKNKGEGPPSDFWSWRKYGQKPIKGSPYPRGYYKCSTSKGCSAKKQVERCKTDASVLIITYTSNHSHPGPDLPSVNPTNHALQTLQSEEVSNNPNSPKESSKESHEEDPVKEKVAEDREKSNDEMKDMMGFSPGALNTSEENDNGFFDELEELPISSSFTSLVRSSIFDERLLLLPY